MIVCVCRYQGYIGAALVLGGVDCNGPHLYSIYPHGSTDKLPYVTMGQSLTHHTLRRDPGLFRLMGHRNISSLVFTK